METGEIMAGKSGITENYRVFNFAFDKIKCHEDTKTQKILPSTKRIIATEARRARNGTCISLCSLTALAIYFSSEAA